MAHVKRHFGRTSFAHDSHASSARLLASSVAEALSRICSSWLISSGVGTASPNASLSEISEECFCRGRRTTNHSSDQAMNQESRRMTATPPPEWSQTDRLRAENCSVHQLP